MPLRTNYLFKKTIEVVFIRNEYDIIQIKLKGCSTLAKTHYNKLAKRLTLFLFQCI